MNASAGHDGELVIRCRNCAGEGSVVPRQWQGQDGPNVPRMQCPDCGGTGEVRQRVTNLTVNVRARERDTSLERYRTGGWCELLHDEFTCDECGWLCTGWRYTLYQQEEEYCRRCEQEGAFDPHCEHDYGETSWHMSCANCERLRCAVRAQEEHEGCPPDALAPALGDLMEAFAPYTAGRRAYAQRFAEMFPGAWHPCLEGWEDWE